MTSEQLHGYLSHNAVPMAVFAGSCFKAFGRGMVMLGFNKELPEKPSYVALEAMRAAEFSEGLIRQIEVYDPDRYAIILAKVCDGDECRADTVHLELIGADGGPSNN